MVPSLESRNVATTTTTTTKAATATTTTTRKRPRSTTNSQIHPMSNSSKISQSRHSLSDDNNNACSTNDDSYRRHNDNNNNNNYKFAKQCCVVLITIMVSNLVLAWLVHIAHDQHQQYHPQDGIIDDLYRKSSTVSSLSLVLDSIRSVVGLHRSLTTTIEASIEMARANERADRRFMNRYDHHPRPRRRTTTTAATIRKQEYRRQLLRTTASKDDVKEGTKLDTIDNGSGDGSTSSSSTTTTTTSSSTLRRRELIIGGSTAPTGRYPYFVALIDSDEDTVFTLDEMECGGTLIATDIVLTASQCKGITHVFVGGGTYTENMTLSTAPTGTEIIPVVQDVDHPFSNGIRNYEYRILKLQRPTTIGRPISVFNTDPTIPSVGIKNNVTTMGYGVTSYVRTTDTDGSRNVTVGPNSNTLQVVDVTVMSSATCNRVGPPPPLDGELIDPFLETYYDAITDEMICAFDVNDNVVGTTTTSNQDFCLGDTGSPLILQGDSVDGSQDTLVGMASWGFDCASDTFPGVYSRTSFQFDFIRTISCKLASDVSSLPFVCPLPAPPPIDPSIPTVPVTVMIVFDEFPSDIGWTLVDGVTWDVVAKVDYNKDPRYQNGGGPQFVNTVDRQTFNLQQEREYIFSIRDKLFTGLDPPGTYKVIAGELASDNQIDVEANAVLVDAINEDFVDVTETAFNVPLATELTRSPSAIPTIAPTETASESPTLFPTVFVSNAPTFPPTRVPTAQPTVTPPVTVPSPGEQATSPVSVPTTSSSSGGGGSGGAAPTRQPTLITNSPTFVPTPSPTNAPSPQPTKSPTRSPTPLPTPRPTISAACCEENDENNDGGLLVGCSNSDCETAVCDVLGESSCCTTQWNNACVSLAQQQCDVCATGAPTQQPSVSLTIPTNSCCEAGDASVAVEVATATTRDTNTDTIEVRKLQQEGPPFVMPRGCENSQCQAQICATDPFCCNSQWDGQCAEKARNQCNVCATPDPTSSPTTNPTIPPTSSPVVLPSNLCCVGSVEGVLTPGCADQTCQNLVCESNDDPYCCLVDWDGDCAVRAIELCTVCVGFPTPQPTESNGGGVVEPNPSPMDGDNDSGNSPSTGGQVPVETPTDLPLVQLPSLSFTLNPAMPPITMTPSLLEAIGSSNLPTLGNDIDAVPSSPDGTSPPMSSSSPNGGGTPSDSGIGGNGSGSGDNPSETSSSSSSSASTMLPSSSLLLSCRLTIVSTTIMLWTMLLAAGL